MICKRCKNTIPDGSFYCPICGKSYARWHNFRIRLIQSLIIASPFVCMAMIAINAYSLITGAHYIIDMRYGLWLARLSMYNYFPSLYGMDMILLALLLVIFVMAIISIFCIQQGREIAPTFMLITNISAFLWSLSYLFVSLYITDIISPMLGFTVMQMLIFAIWTVVSSICLYKFDYFIY